MVMALLILAFILLVVSILDGYIVLDFGMKERARGWLGMRVAAETETKTKIADVAA